MATEKKHRSAKKATKKAKGEHKGRPSAFAGKTIVKLTKENPRREGSLGHKSFSLIRPGMKYEQYIGAGGRRSDLAYDIAHKFVKLSK